MRILADLKADQLAALDEIAHARNLSRAALIRAAIDDYLVRHHASEGQEVFGLWRGRQIDGLDYQDQLRSEW
jgi:metal-responsive CopG/Arc/MetJ family transcriptional regulator